MKKLSQIGIPTLLVSAIIVFIIIIAGEFVAWQKKQKLQDKTPTFMPTAIPTLNVSSSPESTLKMIPGGKSR